MRSSACSGGPGHTWSQGSDLTGLLPRMDTVSILH